MLQMQPIWNFSKGSRFPNDRAQVLAELIPGTEDFYYFTCLYDQQTGKLDETDALLKTWIERFGQTDRVREIQNRQALLRYPTQPKKTIEYLKESLGLEFNHQRQVPGESPDLPTALDPRVISRDALLKRTLTNPQYNATVQGFTRHAYDWLLSTELDDYHLRDLLQLLDLPDYTKSSHSYCQRPSRL